MPQGRGGVAAPQSTTKAQRGLWEPQLVLQELLGLRSLRPTYENGGRPFGIVVHPWSRSLAVSHGTSGHLSTKWHSDEPCIGWEVPRLKGTPQGNRGQHHNLHFPPEPVCRRCWAGKQVALHLHGLTDPLLNTALTSRHRVLQFHSLQIAGGAK